MKLQKWLNEKGKTVADMARDFHVVHCIVRRWVVGEFIPNREYMQKIIAYTGGQVTPNDFYDIDGGNNGKQQ